MKATSVVEKCDLVRDGGVPAEFRKAAQHALGYLAPITTAPYLVRAGLGPDNWHPCPWRCHGHKVACSDDRQASPHYLRMVADVDIYIRKPDVLSGHMGSDLHYSAHYHALCWHEAKRITIAGQHAGGLAESCPSPLSCEDQQLDGRPRRPHEVEGTPGATSMTWIQKHIAIGIAIGPDNAAKPIIIAEVVTDLCVKDWFFGSQSHGIELV